MISPKQCIILYNESKGFGFNEEEISHHQLFVCILVINYTVDMTETMDFTVISRYSTRY